MNMSSLPAHWNDCVLRLKDRINSRSLWEALEATQPITVENDMLIIGLEAEHFNYATHIQQVAHFSAVSKVVAEVFGQPLQVRLIEGTTLADWEATKAREAQIIAMRATATHSQDTTNPQMQSWESLFDTVARMYNNTPHRALPQGKARYACEALYAVVEALDSLSYSDHSDEMAERNLARLLERIGNASEIPPAALAFELERLRAWRKANPEQG